jgi:glycosyltransferase involved in cell wall biosynthesis
MDRARARVAARPHPGMSRDSVVYVLPDKMGGSLNIVASLVECRQPDGMTHDVVLTRNRLDTDTRFGGRLAADSQTTLDYALPVENIYAVLRRLWHAIPEGGGVLVSNDLLELAMLHLHDPGKMVVQILHGDHEYYYELATRHEPVIDVFAAYSRAMYSELRRRLPHRADDVLYLPYGVRLPLRCRRAEAGPLRLLFSGRLEHGQKGVLDLPLIDRALADRGVGVSWTIVGAGPHGAQLRERWPAPHVTWRGPMAHADVLGLLADFDVFVLPTRNEGFPVALVEAMASGLVPVVSDIASGVPEIVENGVSGFRPPVGDIAAFAAAIEALANDRERLESMSTAARARVATEFEAGVRVRDYQKLFAQWRERRRARPVRLPLPYGSRLDRPWLPNPVVRVVRSGMRQLQGKPW